MKILEKITKIFLSIKSKMILSVLLLKGIKVHKTTQFRCMPFLKLNGKPENIIIGCNVIFHGSVDLRNRENGKIIIEDNVIIEDGCRFVAAKEGIIKIGKNTIITNGAIMNGGGNILIGSDCIFGPYNVINANEHKIGSNDFIRDKEFVYGDIEIGNNVWTGAFISIKKNVNIKDNSIIGAHSFVTNDTKKNSINYGTPSKFIRFRD
jgi:acetyltransferase-like isoleucine patch superfamily enzyme